MIHIQTADGVISPVADSLVKHTAHTALQLAAAPPDAELTILLSDDAELQRLNLRFLGIDAPTDVLSFPSGETDPETGLLYLGDVVISISRATAQADAANHAVSGEIQLLIVHGILHLLGYDHADEVEKARMWQMQQRILNSLGLSDLAPKSQSQ